MKYNLLLFFLIIAQSSFSQITQSDITLIPKGKSIVYDSTYNIKYCSSNSEYLQYVNQEILFYERSASSDIKSTLYGNFYLQTPDTIWHKVKKKPKPSDYTLISRYKAKYFTEGEVCFGDTYSIKPTFRFDYYTPAEEIEGKKFKIIHVGTNESSFKASTLVFTLLSTTNDTVLWNVRILNQDYSFPCIIYSFYQRIEQNYVNKTFVIQGQSYLLKKGIDLKNGEKVVLDDTLKCTSVRFVGLPKDYQIPCLILTGNSNREFAIPITPTPKASSYLDAEIALSHIKTDDATPSSLTDLEIIKEKERIRKEEERILKEKIEKQVRQEIAEKEKRCLKKFGREITDLILVRKVRIGMTEEMCEEAWGFPRKINKTTGTFGIHEQWVYDGGYLYFENGKLKVIQN